MKRILRGRRKWSIRSIIHIVGAEDLDKYAIPFLKAVYSAWKTKKETTYLEYTLIPRWFGVVVRWGIKDIEIFPTKTLEEMEERGLII